MIELLSEDQLKASFLASLPEKNRAAFLDSLSDDEMIELEYNWNVWARPNQMIPGGNWITWLILAGRGYGKTRTGAESVRYVVEQGLAGRIALIGRTAADIRDTMITGESGILGICSPYFRPEYIKSQRLLRWPNGAICTTYSAEQPDALRGPQHDYYWADELAAWKYAEETWDQLMFGLRLGSNPRGIITTTPRPIKILRDIMADSSTFITRGSTYENKANLASTFINRILQKYEGTRLGRQELEAELLDDTPGALWKLRLIDQLRTKNEPEMKRVVIAVDPAVTASDQSDETGITVAGLGADEHGYVLDDLSDTYSPAEWAKKAVYAYHLYAADCIVAEVNNGGDLVERNIKVEDPSVPVKKVWASRGKYTRAEPISSLYEQGRVHHVGTFATLEDQMCDYVPGISKKSPDRMDSLVWGLTELFFGVQVVKPKVRTRKI